MRELIKTNAALLFIGIASFVLMGAGQAVYGPALPAFSRSFDVSLGTAGFLISAHWIGCGLGVGLMFWLGARATPRHVVLAMGSGSILIALSLNFAMVLAGAVLFGAGYGAATVVFNGRVLRVFGARGTAMLSLMNACFGIGAIAAPLIFVAFNNAPAPTFAVFALCAAVIWAAGKIQAEGVQQAQTQAPFQLDMPILAFHALAIGTEASLIGLGPAALLAAGATEVWAAQLLSIFFVGFLAARLLLVFVAHLLAPFTLATLAIGGAGIASLGAAMFPPDLFFVVMGFCAGVFFPTIYVAATQKMGGSARVSPTIITAGLIGGILMPLILSPMMAHWGERGFFWVFAALLGMMTVVAVLFRKRFNV